MADTKESAFPALTTVGAADSIPVISAGVTSKGTATMVRGYLTNASTANQTGFAADQYLAGSAITIPTAGGWQVGTTYRCQFDMAKTAAGTAAWVLSIRMGTLGTTGDAAIQTLTTTAQTAVADTGIFFLTVAFRSVGSGTSAVIIPTLALFHNNVATGLTTNGGGSNYIQAPGPSAGFASTTQTVIGLSFNGGASFSGTNTLVTASAEKI